MIYSWLTFNWVRGQFDGFIDEVEAVMRRSVGTSVVAAEQNHGDVTSGYFWNYRNLHVLFSYNW